MREMGRWVRPPTMALPSTPSFSSRLASPSTPRATFTSRTVIISSGGSRTMRSLRWREMGRLVRAATTAQPPALSFCPTASLWTPPAPFTSRMRLTGGSARFRNGTITTVAGGGSSPGDNGPATTAQVLPNAVAVGSSRGLYRKHLHRGQLCSADPQGFEWDNHDRGGRRLTRRLVAWR